MKKIEDIWCFFSLHSKMICNAILKNAAGKLISTRCLSTCVENSLFCQNHQDITIEEYKRRWFDLFILGVDDHTPFLYSYNEKYKNRIIGDLQLGRIILTAEDIEKIPNKALYIDIYLLLLEYGYIDLHEKKNMNLYSRCLKYFSDCISLQLPGTCATVGARKKIRDVLILKNTDHLYFFLCMIIDFNKFSTFKGENLPNQLNLLQLFLKDILRSEIGKEFLWGQFSSLVETYKNRKKQKEENLVFDYLFQEFLPLCKEYLKVEKKKQKDRIDVFKEELMMICWHPDRFIDYCLDEEEKAEIKSLP